jgi:hypothetical protein
LQEAGLISYSRGRIKILKPEALKDSACECYDTVKLHYEKLLGASAAKSETPYHPAQLPNRRGVVFWFLKRAVSEGCSSLLFTGYNVGLIQHDTD